MSQRTFIAVSLSVVGAGTLWWYLNRPDQGVSVKDLPLIEISVDNIRDYFEPNTASYTLKSEQLVEIEGRIKEINTLNSRYTILLKGTLDESPYIICDMQAGQEKELILLKENDTIKVKGIFKGFLKDAILLNCMITHHNLHE